ncbi:MAG: alpha/beta fold hydrolase [Sphingobacteriaceae bacterium]
MNVLKRNNVNLIGSGKQFMMFAHGFGCDQNVWNYIVDAFSADYTPVLFDYVGSGKSDIASYTSERYSSLAGYAEDILEICTELSIKNAVFVGHSVSSMIGLLAAKKDPSLFSRLVFIGPSACYINEEGYVGGFEREDLMGLFDMMDSNYLGWSTALAPQIMGNPDRPELGLALTDSFCATDPVIAKEFAKVTFLSDNRRDLSSVTIPSLTVQCSQDIIAPVEVGEYVAAHTPHNRYVLIDAVGHCPHMSAPEATIKAIQGFLQ